MVVLPTPSLLAISLCEISLKFDFMKGSMSCLFSESIIAPIKPQNYTALHAY
jgi:hypothetical protein